jgi:mono/diheme cytochrome c family protein
MKKLVKWTGIVLGGLLGLAVLAGLALYPIGMKKLTRSYPGIPVEVVNIPTDPTGVAHGRHIAIVWGCTKCHGENLSGKLLSGDPLLGTIPASNLTSGKGGIGRSYTDADWIRAIRHGIKPNSQVEVFMYDYYSTLSDQDLGDLIAYLKQISPVDADFPALRYGSILPIAPAIGLFTPAAEHIDHGAPRPADPAPGATIAYGRYLSVLCTECHGNNLAGKLEKWTQEDFVRAVRTGVLPNGRQLPSAMPSKTLGEMNDTELAALWLYLQSLQAVNSQK